ncbi:MAG TPA: ABC transporter substrate-binding protein [Pirellulales bacterium]|jgi:NitT/TauT family transport system substrate-binding protein|nr:ABC transporter substrate-binding protein [Pirellulales bacterium]
MPNKRCKERGPSSAGAMISTVLTGSALLFAALLIGCDRSATHREAPAGTSPAGETKRPAKKLTLALNWFPESEHGGYYAAQVRGFYSAAGFEVTIQSGGPNAHMMEEVAAGRADFGVANADNILFAQAQNAGVVAVMAPLQNSPRCLLVHKASEIERFDQLRDVTLAMTPGAAFANFLRWKLPLPGVRIVPYSGNVQAFLQDPRYVQQGYTFSEPFIARQQGADPRVLLVSDLGFNPYTSLLFTTETMLATQPDVVRAMVAATVNGWQDYLVDPEPTNRLIHERNPVVDLEALAFGAHEIAPLIVADEAAEQGIGCMTPKRWQTIEQQLVESGQLTADAVDPRRAFTTDFLPPPKPAASPAQ